MEAALLKVGGQSGWNTFNISLSFICSRGDYFCELQDNLHTLKNEVNRLLELVGHVQSRIQRENLRRVQKRYEVNDWFNRVDAFQFDVLQNIIDAEEEIKDKCVRFFCPKTKNCCSCNRVGIRVSKKLECVKELIIDGNNFSDVVETIPNIENGLVTSVMDIVLHTGRTIGLIWSSAANKVWA